MNRVRTGRFTETHCASDADLCAAEDALRQHAPELHLKLQLLLLRADGAEEASALRRCVLARRDTVGCSAFAVSGRHTVDGIPLFGRNWDFRPGAGQNARICRTVPARGLAHLGFTNHPIGRYGGVNEAGLTIATAIVPARRRGSGLRFPLITRRILERCSTADEAAEFLRAVPHASAVNYLIMDGREAICLIEAEPGRVHTAESREFAAMSNHFASEPEEEARPRLPKSRRRVGTLYHWFRRRAGRLDPAAARGILSDQTDGICARGNPEVEHATVTLWSWVARPGTQTVWTAEGSPHRTPYRTVQVPRTTAGRTGAAGGPS